MWVTIFEERQEYLQEKSTKLQERSRIGVFVGGWFLFNKNSDQIMLKTIFTSLNFVCSINLRLLNW